ncbi:MAG: hypothetical protein GF329_16055, partial [Candidatus Lokiarchaeota archaeon]|nr:hypothetical protein [Candidatus Lokiarchaeota archaeon]
LKVLHPNIPEQKTYVKKLNIILGGFNEYLRNKIQFTLFSIVPILRNIKLFIQDYHLGYSEKLLLELDEDELTYFLSEFLPLKFMNLSKSDLKSMCKSLNVFITFLRDKLNYYNDEGIYKRMIDAIKVDKIINTISLDEQKDIGKELINLLSSVVGIEINDFEGVNEYFLEFLGEIYNLEDKERLKMEKKKKKIIDTINLEINLEPWYSTREINVGRIILDNVCKNIHKLKNVYSNGLLAAIDYALNEIFSKTTTQKQIAKRHNISTNTLIKYRYAIANCIPLEYFFPIFISESDLESNKEITYIFKINNFYESRNFFKFELLESNTLQDLHYVIQGIMKEVDFFGGHLYSFFMSGKEWDSSTEYSGPPENQHHYSSQNTDVALKDVNLGYKQKFLYLYDYGDCIKYNVMLVGLDIYDENKKYPHRIK